MASDQGFHEDFTRAEHIEGSTDRGFGVVFAVFFALIGGVKLWIGNSLWPWWFAAAATVAVVAWLRPVWLAPFNRLWMKFGLLLFTFISPVVLGLLYFCVIVPTGWLLHVCNKDILRRRLDPDAPTYWIARDPPGPAPESMKNQF
jgi:hypothetical protein